MIDGALALARSGHSGEVIGLSRRGLLPAVHDVRGPAFPPIELRIEKLKLRSLISTVRGAIHTAQKEGIPWQAVLDSLRSRTPEIWSHLSLTDQRRFLRHIKSYWETNRHRLAPELYREIESLRCSGRLRIIAGNLARVRSVGERFAIELRSRGSSSLEQLEVDRIINCTGPEGKLDRDTSPLFRTLFDAQLLARDSLGFGLRASPQGFVINDRGEVSSSLLTLGSLLKGSLWETTAVPEIRVQAAAIGEAIRGRLGSP
jgi:uncharacterized NAD(P)/FAD-binding protein YdhS